MQELERAKVIEAYAKGVLAWGAVAFGNVPGLQVYVVQRAESGTDHSSSSG